MHEDSHLEADYEDRYTIHDYLDDMEAFGEAEDAWDLDDTEDEDEPFHPMDDMSNAWRSSSNVGFSVPA